MFDLYLFSTLLLTILLESYLFYNSLILSTSKRKILNIPGIYWKMDEHIRSKIFLSTIFLFYICLPVCHAYFSIREKNSTSFMYANNIFYIKMILMCVYVCDMYIFI